MCRKPVKEPGLQWQSLKREDIRETKHECLHCTYLNIYRLLLQTLKNSNFSLALSPTYFILPVLLSESTASGVVGRNVILTRMECFAKLVVRQSKVSGVGMGRVMSEGVYLMLQV